MDIFDKYIIETEKEKVKDNRLNEQKNKKDYSYEENGKIETCDNCRSNINSRGHCPLCDY